MASNHTLYALCLPTLIMVAVILVFIIELYRHVTALTSYYHATNAEAVDTPWAGRSFLAQRYAEELPRRRRRKR